MQFRFPSELRVGNIILGEKSTIKVTSVIKDACGKGKTHVNTNLCYDNIVELVIWSK